MTSNNDIFADLLTDFKSSTSKKDVNNTVLKKSSDTKNTKNDIPLTPKNIIKNNNTNQSFDDIFPSKNINTSHDLFDDIFIPEISNKTNIQKESPELDDNPFETYKSDINDKHPNVDDSLLLDMNEHLPHTAGFFTSPFDIIQKGKDFIQGQLSFNEDLLGSTIKNPPKQHGKVLRKDFDKREQSAPIVEDLLLLDINDKPKERVIKSSTNLLDHTNISSPQDLVPKGFITNISNFERESYFDFKLQGINAFKIGHYDMALEKFKMASESIPQNHIYQVILIRNLISTSFKLGDLQAVKNYLDDVFTKLHLNNFNSWCRFSIIERQSIPLKDIIKKILISKGEYHEAKEELQLALIVYKEMLDLGLGDENVVKKKQRLDKVLNPKKYTSPKTYIQTEVKSKTPRVPKQRENVDTTEIKAKVMKKIDMWQRDKSSDLRFLLSSLDTILPNWTKIDSKNLISPKKCKVYYFKAISHTHPDKVDPNATAESRILCETVFMTLNKAWEAFKEENDL